MRACRGQERKRILVRYEHGHDGRPFSCSYVRLLLPLTHPQNLPRLAISTGDDAPCHGQDMVVVERHWRPDCSPAMAEAAIQEVRAAGARLIYALDDNLLDLPQTSDAQKAFVRTIAEAADGLLVSTEPLRQRFSALCGRISVVPNVIDERLFVRPANRERWPGRPLVIGYMGTFTHDADLLLVAEALRRVLGRHAGRVELQLVGAVARPETLACFAGLPLRLVMPRRWDMEYPRFIRWMAANAGFDLAIAPLADTPLNHSKSDIKFLDYSALGIPGIYSRLGPYPSTVRHLHTGYLAENTSEAWEEGLEQMLAAESLRIWLAENARRYVFSRRTLLHCAGQWPEALARLCAPAVPSFLESQAA